MTSIINRLRKHERHAHETSVAERAAVYRQPRLPHVSLMFAQFVVIERYEAHVREAAADGTNHALQDLASPVKCSRGNRRAMRSISISQVQSQSLSQAITARCKAVLLAPGHGWT